LNPEVTLESRKDLIFILKELYKLNSSGIKGSRQILLSKANNQGFNMSEQVIRNRLNELENLGYVEKRKGKFGTIITTKGMKLVQVVGD
jgi:repressor of nif and glnA expression